MKNITENERDRIENKKVCLFTAATTPALFCLGGGTSLSLGAIVALAAELSTISVGRGMLLGGLSLLGTGIVYSALLCCIRNRGVSKEEQAKLITNKSAQQEYNTDGLGAV